MTLLRLAPLALAAGLAGAGCAVEFRSTATEPLGPETLTQLWAEPDDLAARDLYYGVGGRALEPRPDQPFKFVELDTDGHSRGYEVVDAEGRDWDVKIGDEAQTEVVVSRLLWAIGFHQPAVYYVPRWTLTHFNGKAPEPGRFRFEGDYENEGEWSWEENLFVGTRPFHGLLVANAIVNNWDFKTSNNRIYRVKGDTGPATRYVVQDLGASFGKTRLFPVGTRNDLEDFESQPLIDKVEGARVDIAFNGRHRNLFKDITREDVIWTCRLLDRITDRQWHDAFRAAGYAEPVRARFIAKIKSKVQEGLALDGQAN